MEAKARPLNPIGRLARKFGFTPTMSPPWAWLFRTAVESRYMLDCPFCGKKPTVETTPFMFNGKDGHRIICRNCNNVNDINASTNWFDNRLTMQNAWNTRAGVLSKPVNNEQDAKL